LRHERREGDDAHGEGDHRRVERVLSEPAVQVLGHDDGESGANHDQPPRRERRKRERDQPGRDDGAAVAEKGAKRFVQCSFSMTASASSAVAVAIAICTSTTGPISQA
jgi:hypothetical protein